MKRFALIFALLLCPALCVAQSAPMPQSAAVLVKPTGIVTPITANTAAKVRTLSESESVTSDDLIRFNGSGTYDFDDDPPSATPRYIGAGAGVTVWVIDGNSTDHGDLIERCRDLSIQFNDKTLPLGLQVDSSGNLVSKLLLRSGTAAEINEIVLDVGEPAWKTDTYQLVVGDGSTAGGRSVGPSLGAAILAKADGIRSFVYLAEEDSNSARGTAIITALDAAESGDTVVVPFGVTARIESPLNRNGVTLFNFGAIQYVALTDAAINLTTAQTFTFCNYGRLDASTVNAITVSHASASLAIKGDGGVVGGSFGRALDVSNGSVEVYGGWFFGGAGGIRRTGGTVYVYPFVIGATSGTISRPNNSFFNITPGSGFLSLIDDATAADIRNTAGASGGIFQSSAGGTGNGFTKFTGPTTSEKTYTLPNSNATLLHGTPNGIVKGDGSGGTSAAVAGTDYVTPGTIAIGNLILSGAKFVNAGSASAASGFTDVYTCPSGKRAIVLRSSILNVSGGAINFYWAVKISSNYYRLSTITNVVNGGAGLMLDHGYVLEAGESLAFNSDTASSTIHNRVALVEIPDTSPLKTVKLTSFTNGNNTLYTCPSGKSSLLLDNQFGTNVAVNNIGVMYTNDSGSTATHSLYFVPNGQSAGNQWRLNSTAGTSTGAARQLRSAVIALNAGDSIVFNTDQTGTQFLWATLIEQTDP